MAKLTEAQLKEKVEREQKRQNAIKKKKEILKEKQSLGEDFYRNQYKEMLNGDVIRSRVVDILDIDDYIPMIEEDIESSVDYKEYPTLQEFEEERKQEFEKLSDDLPWDGEMGLSSLTPVPKRTRKEIESKDKLALSSKQLSYINDRNKQVKKYFHTSTPKYNYHICSCCGKPQNIEEYYRGWSILYANKMDINGIFHTPWCKTCCKKTFDYYFNVYENNAEIAMERFCCDTNTYWDIDIFRTCLRTMDNKERQCHLMSEYFGLLGQSAIYGRTYWDSPTIQNRNITIVHGENNELETKLVYDPDVLKVVSKQKNKDVLAPYKIPTKDENHGAPLTWSKKDAQNKIRIEKMFGYDPWDYMEEVDKKIIYADFFNILELGMEDDFTKLQSAMQIVTSYHRIRELSKLIAEKTKNRAPDSEIKSLSDQLAKERASVSTITKDQGFSQRYSDSKAKGETTLSGMLAKMSNAQYEKALPNAYDMETSSSIQQVANISMKAIFDQLSFSESETWQICQDQLARLKSLEKQKDELMENLRLANYKIKEMELEKTARKKEAEEDYD